MDKFEKAAEDFSKGEKTHDFRQFIQDALAEGRSNPGEYQHFLNQVNEKLQSNGTLPNLGISGLDKNDNVRITGVDPRDVLLYDDSTGQTLELRDYAPEWRNLTPSRAGDGHIDPEKFTGVGDQASYDKDGRVAVVTSRLGIEQDFIYDQDGGKTIGEILETDWGHSGTREDARQYYAPPESQQLLGNVQVDSDGNVVYVQPDGRRVITRPNGSQSVIDQ